MRKNGPNFLLLQTFRFTVRNLSDPQEGGGVGRGVTLLLPPKHRSGSDRGRGGACEPEASI